MLPASPTRSFVALAFADELLEHPELLADYGRAFGADDDATLAILAPGADGAQVAAALGPNASIDAVYSRRAPIQPFAGLPHTGDPAELRRALAPAAPALDFVYVDGTRPVADAIAEWESGAQRLPAGGLIAITGADSPASSLLRQRTSDDPQWDTVVVEPGC